VARSPETGLETHQVVTARTPGISQAARVGMAAGLITASGPPTTGTALFTPLGQHGARASLMR
jgi:hypothetical protein